MQNQNSNPVPPLSADNQNSGQPGSASNSSKIYTGLTRFNDIG